ncbi:MAG: MOSC domain-containing protein [Oscillospiraceae bacterium]|nr:MOSC domain-containing protein [Oscillospiraceae bacterium]
MAKVLAVCISEVRGIQKHPVPEAELRAGHGIVGDAHAGPWHRQVSLLGCDSVQKLQERITMKLKPGDFAENILVEGMTVYQLPVGAKLHLGTALVEVTQIGKECHADCAIRRQAGDCVMPREGIFVRVLQDGTVKPGDELRMAE